MKAKHVVTGSERDVKISNVSYVKTAIFCQKDVRSFSSAKAFHNFSAKNITTIDLEKAGRLNESVTNNFIQLTKI
ncbi:MAG: hypothetical protein AB2705_19945 [Candidatus Thiodiazotropha sp.]